MNVDQTTSAFLPVLLLAMTALFWNSFQCLQLVTERGNLQTVISEQTPQMEQSRKVREALESLSARTARLAKGGNANATIVVEELRKRGITIDLDAPASDKPEAATP
jgi:hypothetical protein